MNTRTIDRRWNVGMIMPVMMMMICSFVPFIHTLPSFVCFVDFIWIKKKKEEDFPSLDETINRHSITGYSLSRLRSDWEWGKLPSQQLPLFSLLLFFKPFSAPSWIQQPYQWILVIDQREKWSRSPTGKPMFLLQLSKRHQVSEVDVLIGI
jgi:hypothetical protein